jgi:hypothetical protein
MTAQPKKEQKTKIPPWVHEYFTRAYDSHERLLRVIQVSKRGISSARAMPRLRKALANVEGKDTDPKVDKLVAEDAELAKTEVDQDFPVLNSLATIAIWSWLEHLIKGLLAEQIFHDRKAAKHPAFQKIRVKLSDYASLSKREQSSYLIELIEQDLAAPLKRGATRFESILEPFGLTGAVTPEISKAIFELQQVRNVIAHQNGRCDRGLKQSCPWLKLKIGQETCVTSKQVATYAEATAEYALHVLYRIGDQNGVDLRVSPDDT